MVNLYFPLLISHPKSLYHSNRLMVHRSMLRSNLSLSVRDDIVQFFTSKMPLFCGSVFYCVKKKRDVWEINYSCLAEVFKFAEFDIYLLRLFVLT